MNTTETSLRVRFAKARGYVFHEAEWQGTEPHKWLRPAYWTLNGKQSEPSPIIDANTVREAMMGMTGSEWVTFRALLADRLRIRNFSTLPVIEAVLRVEPATLAELVCEVRNVP